jgi:hypothetical protein
VRVLLSPDSAQPISATTRSVRALLQLHTSPPFPCLSREVCARDLRTSTAVCRGRILFTSPHASPTQLPKTLPAVPAHSKPIALSCQTGQAYFNAPYRNHRGPGKAFTLRIFLPRCLRYGPRRSRRLPRTAKSRSRKSKINFNPSLSITYKPLALARHFIPQTHLLPCNREPERTHDVSGRCPLSSRDHGGISLKQWAAGAPVIGAAPVSSGKPKRPRSEGLSGSGALRPIFRDAGDLRSPALPLKGNEQHAKGTKTYALR